MDEMNKESTTPETTTQETKPSVPAPRQRPERRRKTKQELFKENTLPFIILGVAAILIVTFIIGSVVRGVQKKNAEAAASAAASESMAAEDVRLNDEMQTILADAERLAASYDYDGAIALIDSFSGNIGAYPQLQDARVNYEYSKGGLLVWDDPNSIINLSFQTLVADPGRAYTNASYGDSMKRNFITVSEFEKVLERLYNNNYVLVGLKDIITATTDENGTITYAYKELYLPEGKKPVVLTQTNVNYNLYLVDSDEDMKPDQGGVGIASKLVLQDDGSITCEMVDSSGNTVTGAYDLVPILDQFVADHPDFSYHGAKAVLALTGYNGLFGYRTHAEARETFGEQVYNENVAAVKELAAVLQDSGYELGCYTYANAPYGGFSLSEIQADMQQWVDEVTPILGTLDIMVFAQDSDINNGMLYSGEKYDYLKSVGFNYFLGYCGDGDSFTFVSEEYVRQGRLLVNGTNLTQNAAWFNGIFDTDGILDAARGTEEE